MKRFSDPTTLILIGVMAIIAIRSGRFDDPVGWLISTLLLLPGIIIALSFHEFAHAISAYKMGDFTPKFEKRVSLNPVRHIDPFGMICIIFIGFGWGKPVMINPLNFRRRKLAEIIVSLAGVTMNLFLALLFGLIHALFINFAGLFIFSGLGWVISMLLTYTIWINLVLMVFNLLPIPPLDGFSVVTELLGIKYTETYYKIYNNGMWILMLLIIFDVVPLILQYTVFPLYNFLTNLYLFF